jgi:DNA-binding winged helix-turn-helix (wHTH) protein
MPTHAGAAIYHFDRFVLDLGRGMLSVAGAERALRPKSFALLRHFVEKRGTPDRSRRDHASRLARRIRH